MTVSSETGRNDYTGTGLVSAYDYTFRVLDEADLRVVVSDSDDVETVLVLTTDYTVDGVGDGDGGTITLTAGVLASGHRISIRRFPVLVQGTDLRNQTATHNEDLEDAYDRVVMIAQRLQDELARALRLPETEAGTTVKTLLPRDRASKFLAFDAASRPIAAEGSTGAVPVTAFAATLLDDVTAAEARATLGSVPSVVESIAALKALASTDLAGTVIVRGYYAANDGGGGVFRYNAGDATADNNGTVIQPSVGTGRWNRLYDENLNVKWFGCKCDGATDDTTNFNLCITAALALAKNVIIDIPGKLKVTTTISLSGSIPVSGYAYPVYGTLKFRGVNGGTVFSTIAAGDIFRLGTNLANMAFILAMENLEIDANQNNVIAINGASYDVGGTFNNRVSFDNVTIRGLQGAASMGFNGASCTDSYCNRLSVFGYGTGCGIGVKVHRSNVRLVEPLIQYCLTGLYLEQSAESNVQVIGGSILSNAVGVRFQGGGYNYNSCYFFGTMIGESSGTFQAIVVDTPAAAQFQATFVGCLFDSSRADYICLLDCGGKFNFMGCVNWYASTTNKIKIGQYTTCNLIGNTNLVLDPTSHAGGLALTNRLFDERLDQDVVANGGFRTNVAYSRNVTAGLAGTQMTKALTIVDFVAQTAGSIVGISASLSAALAGAGVTFLVAKNGVGVTNCEAAMVIGNQYKVVNFAKDLYSFAAGDRLRVLIYSGAISAPVDASVDVQIEF